MVHTSETMRYRYFLDLLMARSRPVMLVGAAGSGKTVLLQDKLSSTLIHMSMPLRKS
jgi:dynein heavy chain